VTGASDGIGCAFARQLALAGIHLVLVARRGEVLERLAAELREVHRVETRVVIAVLTEASAVEAVLDATRALDIGLLVAAAGYGTSGRFLTLPLSHELEMIDVNCRAVTALTHAFADRIAQRGRGGIVLLSSLLAFQGVARAATYAATKAFVQSLAEGLRLELAPDGVDVVAAAPGPTHSGFAVRARMRMARATSPDVVARGTLAALGCRGTVRPGWLSKLLEWRLKPNPRAVRVRILSRIMDGMVKG
jgi:short-subunit dehydrogenase